MPTSPSDAAPQPYFTVLTRCWYAAAKLRRRDHVVDQVRIHIHKGEFWIEFLDLERGKPPAARLGLFDKEWARLDQGSRLLVVALWTRFVALPAAQRTPDALAAILEEAGFVDRSEPAMPERIAALVAAGEL